MNSKDSFVVMFSSLLHCYYTHTIKLQGDTMEVKHLSKRFSLNLKHVLHRRASNNDSFEKRKNFRSGNVSVLAQLPN